MSNDGLQDAIDEIRSVAEFDRRKRQRQAFINQEYAELNGDIIGNIEELPLWAQAYIKALRTALYDTTAEIR